ncbi:acyl-CoA thioesterase [Symbiobacterium terraclitae]|uniref:acyl-CoA thioesterase n=1 Tax=Symbiobacterium terraclitae TaxID=557451 RepID=UPI0035B55CF5
MQVDTEIRVRFREVDSARVVHHSHFFDWFEVGRFDLVQKLFGVTPEDFQAHGIISPVIEAHCRYRSPARWGDRLIVRTRLQPSEVARFTFDYEVYRDSPEGELLATGYTTHVFVSPEGRLLVEVPPLLRERMAARQGVGL